MILHITQMSIRVNTILIIGAGGGIGEALAREFHSLGKKLIITGREQDRNRLSQLAQDLPGTESCLVCFPRCYLST